MHLLKKQKSAIGLDIGTSMVKAVKITGKGGDYVLDSFAIEPIPDGTVQSGEIKDPSALAQAALKAVKRCDAQSKDVIVALPNNAILSEVLTMGIVPDKQMREAVMVEAEQMSAFDLNDVEIDYAVLGRDEAARQMKVLMVVAKNDIIYSYIDFLNEAGLRPSILDVDLFALNNIVHQNYDFDTYKTCVLLNIGSETTVAAFLKNGVFHSSRDISVAGITFKKGLEAVPNLAGPKIHEVLRGVVSADVDLDRVTAALNESNKEFVNAVGVALSYFQASDAVDKIDLIIVSGGYAWTPGLINALELRTGAEAVILDPFTRIRVKEGAMGAGEPQRLGTMLSVARGLATRSL
jgi:type IV pilus assembly protein PilM